MSDLLALAERCEAATGPDREMDREIFLAIHHPDYRFPARVLNRKPADRLEALERMYLDGGGGSTYRDVLYTASLDAALTLVPEGWAWSVGFDTHGNRAITGPMGSLDAFVGKAATPALALCAAALRARAEILP